MADGSVAEAVAVTAVVAVAVAVAIKTKKAAKPFNVMNMQGF